MLVNPREAPHVAVGHLCYFSLWKVPSLMSPSVLETSLRLGRMRKSNQTFRNVGRGMQ